MKSDGVDTVNVGAFPEAISRSKGTQCGVKRFVRGPVIHHASGFQSIHNLEDHPRM